MDLPPRSLKSKLFTGKDLLRSFLQGLFVLAIISVVLLYDTSTHDDPNRTRTLGFIILAMSNMGLIFADMCDGSLRQLIAIFKKPLNWFIVLGVALCLLLTTIIPQIRSLFHFAPLQLHEFVASIGIAMLVFIIISTWNRLAHRY